MSRFPLFETLLVLNGQVQNLSYHQQRFEQAVRELFGIRPNFALAEILVVPAEFQQGKVRCRIDYNAENFTIKFAPHTPKKIEYFRCIEVKNWDYHLKFSNRTQFDSLDILPNEEVIIINNGKISDCSVGNLLFLKQGIWYSPQDYLLKGTQLTKLLMQKKVKPAQITRQDLSRYEKVMLINALNPFDEQRALPCSQIYFFDQDPKY